MQISLSIAERKISPWIAGIWLLGFSLLRTRQFLGGRFWAEEGAIFFSEIHHRSAIASLFFIFHGHLELLTNALVLAASRVPLAFAPLVTTYVSALLAIVFPVFAWVFRRNIGLSDVAWFALVVGMLGLPQAEEVWANSINLHFHAALALSIVLCLPIETFPAWVLVLLCGLTGLSGIPPNLLAPLFVFRALKAPSLRAIASALTICLTSLAQLGLLIANDWGARRPTLDLNLCIGAVVQQLLSPMFGWHAESLIELAARARDGHVTAVLLVIFCFLALAFLYWTVFSHGSAMAQTAALCALVLLSGSLVGAIGDTKILVSVAGNGRYLYAPNVLFFLAVLLTFTRIVTQRRPAAIAVALLFLAFTVSQPVISGFDLKLPGPSWRESLVAADRQGRTTIAIWPDGWEMKLP